MNTKSLIVTVVVVIVVGVGAFFGGIQVGKAKAPSTATTPTAAGTRAAGTGRGGAAGTRGAGGAFGGGVTGQIISMDATSITVKTQAGSTEIVYFSGKTPITKEDTASSSDLATGDNVVVRGTTSSGTVTATNISIVPTLPAAPTGTGTASNAGTAPAPAAQ
jgi:hypothetical protein